jgi:hypothetical protein
VKVDPKLGGQWNVLKLGDQWKVPNLVVNGMFQDLVANGKVQDLVANGRFQSLVANGREGKKHLFISSHFPPNNFTETFNFSLCPLKFYFTMVLGRYSHISFLFLGL